MLINSIKLNGVHPDLITVINLASRDTDLYVIEGVRDLDRQRRLVKRGASKTLKSKHLMQDTGFAHAVDVAPYVDTDADGDREISWAWPDYYPLAEVIKRVARDLSIPLTWGGDWQHFKDGPHWELR
jgi:peptidoglycan L-alanyl-D-glutamate endopeptidase CwlK